MSECGLRLLGLSRSLKVSMQFPNIYSAPPYPSYSLSIVIEPFVLGWVILYFNKNKSGLFSCPAIQACMDEHVFMPVCLLASIHTCVPDCNNVCLPSCMHTCLPAYMHAWTCMYTCMPASMHACLTVGMHAWSYRSKYFFCPPSLPHGT